MIITTAKRSRLPRPLCLAPMATALLAALPAHAAWNIIPSISLSESYTDNVNLQTDERKQARWVTEASPGVAVTGKSSRLDFDANARLSYYAYSGSDVPGTRSSEQRYNANGRATVIKDLFFVDAGASKRAYSVSAFGPRVEDDGSRYLDENRTDVRTWRVSPYLAHRFGNFASVLARYSHDSVNTDRDRGGYSDSSADSLVLNIASGSGFRRVGWNLRYAHQKLDSQAYGQTTSKNAMLGLSYLINPTLQLTATVGHDSYDYQALGGRTSGVSWSGGFAWAPSPRTSLQMSLGRHFLGNTGSLMALHRSRHTVWNISYSDAVTTTRSQFTLPAAVDTASMLDSLFSPRIPDPLLRRQAVDAYIQAAGLPPTLANSINYLTNRYIRQKLLQASVAANWRHSGAVLSAYVSEREALSLAEVDSSLLGSELRSLNDNVRQYGLSGTYNYRLSARSNARASLTATRTRSLTTGLEDDQKILRLGLSHRLGRNLRGGLEFRHRVGEGDYLRRDYTENAITATISAQL